MIKKILSFFGFNRQPDRKKDEFQIDTAKLVQEIRDREVENNIPQGKQIHSFKYDDFIISLDKEFTGRYRISIFIGSHKVYGFTLTQDEPSDEKLETIFEQIITFLSHAPSVENLPKSDLYKAYFFGNP